MESASSKGAPPFFRMGFGAGAASLFGGDGQIFVGQRVIVNRRTYGGGHVLPAFQSVKGGVGLQAYATDCGVQLFDPPRRPDKGAAGTESGNKMGDAAGGRLPNLVGGGAIVRLPVRR